MPQPRTRKSIKRLEAMRKDIMSKGETGKTTEDYKFYPPTKKGA